MMRTPILPLVLTGLAMPVVAAAQSAAPVSVSPRAGGKAPMTLARFQARHGAKLMAADTNGDGRISRAEFLAAAKPGNRDPARRFATLDRNGNGYIDRREVDAMLARRFARIDTDGDGIASPQERAAARAAKAGAAGGGRGS